MKKRILYVTDPHCGHLVGLCPAEVDPPVTTPKQEKYALVRSQVWDFFAAAVDKYRPYDVAIWGGDMTDGKGSRSGGTELLSNDWKVQVDIAVKVIEFVDASVNRMVYGTPYHVASEGTDIEDFIADKVGARIGSHEWYNINGKIFDVKHKIGSSTIPHGRLTPLAREIMWNRLWYPRQPKADVLLRGHVHYFEQIDHDDCLGFTGPALQGYGSKYGSRECSGKVDIGVLVFDVYDDGEIVWKKELANVSTQTVRAEAL
jgi:hypothetical protein